ncbi:MAG: hypothetical protein A2Z64_13260 [Betaproteobacteria bacterium RIFCSPLOWO2_02_67_12]|nr:MAG: hypothetical protein A2Z64_13260 [Betaproteobacteria bacterium RIFCSPLOWO2_02_67_12]OGA56579.1 MAG: hypothetical protein A3F77_18150 [Betaproteobacteria bacterium RIFCSPLOWO2_12_FULL_67_28]
MRKTLISFSVAAALASPILASAQAPAAPASPHTLAGNAGLFSSYRFRGIDQTFGKPAIQGGIDYSHASGLYAGNWNSNVSEGAGFPAANLEMDFYGGWKKSFGDFGLDVGFIYYYYPGSDANLAAGTSFASPHTTKTHTGRVDNKEIYIGGSWKWFSLKYSHATDDYFSLPGTKGSNYLDLSANYDLGNGWGVNGHVGSFKLKGWSAGTDLTNGDYTDWKLGVTKDVNGWIFGAAYIDTDAKGSCNAVNPGFYCFANQLPAGAGAKLKDAGRGIVVLSVSKTF